MYGPGKYKKMTLLGQCNETTVSGQYNKTFVLGQCNKSMFWDIVGLRLYIGTGNCLTSVLGQKIETSVAEQCNN